MGTRRRHVLEPASIGVMRAIGMTIEENPFPEPTWFQIVGILEARCQAGALSRIMAPEPLIDK